MRNSVNIKQISDLEIDYLGFIFYPKSKRNAENLLDKAVFDAIPKRINKVGVFVNAEKTYIEQMAKKFPFDTLQLHGEESVEYCTYFKPNFEIIKVFSVDNNFDFSSLEAYQTVADYFLFDTKTEQKGGSGKKFDWNVLTNAKIGKPFFLSGGISLEDVPMIKKIISENKYLYALDVNSKFEIEPGLKNSSQIEQLIRELNRK